LIGEQVTVWYVRAKGSTFVHSGTYYEEVTRMPMLWRISNRYSTRATLRVGASIVGLLSLSAALATWQETPIIGAVPILACALVVTVFVLARRALRKASAQIDAIMREELDADRVVPMHSEDVSKLGL
jgi:hypothetical protein